MSLVAVSGKRSDGKLYIDGGYVYSSESVKKGNRYLKCSDALCPGTGVVRCGEEILSSLRPHNHMPNKEDEELALFRDGIRVKAADMNTSDGFRNIYDRESARYPKGSLKRGYPQDEQLMRRSRNRAVPPLPKDLDDLHDILKFQPRWRNHAFAHGTVQEFFRETVVADDDVESRVSVLVSPYFADLLKLEHVELAADATFDVRPSYPVTEQLLSVHAFETIDGNRYCYPCAYALMERKNERAYVAALNAINTAVGGTMRPGTLMADFEKGLHNAAEIVFPGVQTSGCWFHYCNAAYGQARLLGVADACLVDEWADRGLRKCLALPLLPPHHIHDGLAIVQEEMEMQGLKNIFRQFFNYLQDTWLDERKVGVEMLSVFELDARTNNHVESAHYKLFRKLRSSRPNYWVFHGAVKAYDYANHQDRQRVLDLISVRRKRRVAYVTQDTNIKDMQTKLVNGHINLDAFLDRACHAVDGLNGRLRQHHNHILARRENLNNL